MKVTLTKPHRHDGIDYKSGHVIDVPEDIATWLIREGRAESSASRQKPAAAEKSTK